MSRRSWLSAALGFSAAVYGPRARGAEAASFVIPGKRPLLLHNEFPEDVETPLRYFESWLTPLDAFFVRSHLPAPSPSPDSWRLSVAGSVKKPLNLSVSELRRFEQHTVPATLECAGNGRANFRPTVPGIQWQAGAIGNAEWRGVRLADLLRAAEYDASASHINFNGADAGVANTPDFIRSLPMEKALHPATIVALEMNGQPIPRLHGFPARLIVPGWVGSSWVKWLTDISVEYQPHTGFYMDPAYRLPKSPVAPGERPRREDLEPITGMPVKSLIVAPERGSKHKPGAVRISGVAWAGEERIRSVQVSADGGSRWAEAEITSPNLAFAWVVWEYLWTPSRPGYALLMSRAMDSAGRVQPIESLWNPSGYLWNAIDRVGVTVER